MAERCLVPDKVNWGFGNHVQEFVSPQYPNELEVWVAGTLQNSTWWLAARALSGAHVTHDEDAAFGHASKLRWRCEEKAACLRA